MTRRYDHAAAGLRRRLRGLGLPVWLGAVAASGLAGCDLVESVFTDPDEAEGYRLVGAYDASALRSLELQVPEEERPKPYEYIWTPPADMVGSCGPTKAPDGLGIFEAEAIGNRMLPTLALVVERQGGVPSLNSERVQVAIGRDGPEFFLEPAVMPRHLKISIDGNVSPRVVQQIKTQLQTYLCMEHKTGRGWNGGTLGEVRQALLLDPPDQDELTDRKFFGGQKKPVAPLLGPPEACFAPEVALGRGEGTGGQGQSSLSLVPSDVWGASLEPCPPNLMVKEKAEQFRQRRAEGSVTSGLPFPMYTGPGAMRMALSDTPLGSAPAPASTWSEMEIRLEARSLAPTDQYVEVYYHGREHVPGGETPEDAVGMEPLVDERPLFVSLEGGQVGLIDLVSELPYRYPTVGDAVDDERYTVLLVPNWQLVEGIRRMHAGDFEEPRGTAGQGVQDGVGWILDHAENLFVMVPSDPEATVDELSSSADAWDNVAQVMSGGLGGIDFGYTTGMLTGRSPIVLPGTDTPAWTQVLAAQRAPQQSIFLGAVAVLGFFVLVGLVRVRELWTRVPEERVEFWPGPPVEEEEEGDDMGDLSSGDEESE